MNRDYVDRLPSSLTKKKPSFDPVESVVRLRDKLLPTSKVSFKLVPIYH